MERTLWVGTRRGSWRRKRKGQSPEAPGSRGIGPKWQGREKKAKPKETDRKGGRSEESTPIHGMEKTNRKIPGRGH